MGQFLRHEACPRCGSSDANAVYQGGTTYCFSCRRGGGNRYNVIYPDNIINEEVPSLPYDANTSYPPHCLDWVFKYGVTVNELIKHKVFWSEEKQQLIFTFYDEEGKLLLWQARNFGDFGKRLKYITRGKPEQVLPVVRIPHGVEGNSSCLVLVEDCISAIKISRWGSSMPVLGSDLSQAKLTRLSHLPGLSRAIVWLDGNMYPKAQRIAQRLQMLGIEAKAVYTELDPKEYEDEFIASVLQKSA